MWLVLLQLVLLRLHFQKFNGVFGRQMGFYFRQIKSGFPHKIIMFDFSWLFLLLITFWCRTTTYHYVLFHTTTFYIEWLNINCLRFVIERITYLQFAPAGVFVVRASKWVVWEQKTLHSLKGFFGGLVALLWCGYSKTVWSCCCGCVSMMSAARMDELSVGGFRWSWLLIRVCMW